MAEFSRDAYIKQTLIFLDSENYQRAYEFSKEFMEKNPQDMMAQFLFAKSAFWLERYGEAIEHGVKAFNLAHERDDLILCAIILASAYYQAGKYQEGFKLLNALGETKDENVEELLLLFSIALKDNAALEEHVARLYEINSKVIERLLYEE